MKSQEQVDLLIFFKIKPFLTTNYLSVANVVAADIITVLLYLLLLWLAVVVVVIVVSFCRRFTQNEVYLGRT